MSDLRSYVGNDQPVTPQLVDACLPERRTTNYAGAFRREYTKGEEDITTTTVNAFQASSRSRRIISEEPTSEHTVTTSPAVSSPSSNNKTSDNIDAKSPNFPEDDDAVTNKEGMTEASANTTAREDGGYVTEGTTMAAGDVATHASVRARRAQPKLLAMRPPKARTTRLKKPLIG